MEFITVALSDSIGTITFNHDRKRNALGRGLINELIKALNDLIYQRARVIVLRANAGAKVWSAGYDVSEFPQPGRDPLSYDDPLEQAIRAIQRCPAPVIAMIEGSVWGGACELAFVCDILIGTENTSFAITPARLGIPYNLTGILHVLNTLGMPLAREMFFTAQPVSGERAAQARHPQSPGAGGGTGGVHLRHGRPNRRQFPHQHLGHQGAAADPGERPAAVPEAFERIQALRRLVYNSKDYQEGQQAFLEKRQPVFKGE